MGGHLGIWIGSYLRYPLGASSNVNALEVNNTNAANLWATYTAQRIKINIDKLKPSIYSLNMKNPCLIAKAFQVKDGQISSVFYGNPFARKYKMFEQAVAPEDFPFHFILNLDPPRVGTYYNAILACLVEKSNIKARRKPFIISSVAGGSFSKARQSGVYSLAEEGLSVTRFMPVGMLVLCDEEWKSGVMPDPFWKVQEKLELFSWDCRVPMWDHYVK